MSALQSAGEIHGARGAGRSKEAGVAGRPRLNGMGGAIAVAVVLIGVALFLLNSSSGGGSGDSSSGGGGAVPAPGGTALPSAQLQQLAAAIAHDEGVGIE